MVKLKVYYGWSKINAVRKKRSLSVVFENSLECRSQRGQRCLSSIQTTCYERYQTEEEAKDGLKQNRIFTGYDLMFDEKPVNGSLNRILEINSEADKNNISEKEQILIADALRAAFMLDNPDYRDPYGKDK